MEDVFGLIVIAVCVVCVSSLLAALPVMLLWDWLMPELFGLHTITFFQSMGLSALCGLLFRSSSSSSSKS